MTNFVKLALENGSIHPENDMHLRAWNYITQL